MRYNVKRTTAVKNVTEMRNKLLWLSQGTEVRIVLPATTQSSAAPRTLPSCRPRWVFIVYFTEWLLRKEKAPGTTGKILPYLHCHCCPGSSKGQICHKALKWGPILPWCPARDGYCMRVCACVSSHPPFPSPGAEEKTQKTPHLANDKTIIFSSKICDGTGEDCVRRR